MRCNIDPEFLEESSKLAMLVLSRVVANHYINCHSSRHLDNKNGMYVSGLDDARLSGLRN